MDRVILHCDLNCFYASVELLSHPELRTVPMAVCGDPASRHGIILAKNEPAKKFGVQTAETIWQAKKKCPDLVLLPPHHDLYRQYSRRVNAIYDTYTDLVEPFGIDESWLDITHTLHLLGGDPRAVADQLRERIKRELGLTLSVGVSFNKVFAKLGSDYKKPDATTVISRENWRQLLWPLPVGAMLYVGGAAQKLLHQYGVDTLGQLAACKPDMLETLMGKMGPQLLACANGEDQDPVRSRYEAEPVKSVGNGTTFPQNLTKPDQVRTGIAMLCDSVATRLRHGGLYAGGIQVTVRDPAFHDRSRQMQLSSPTHLIRDLTAVAMELTNQLWKPPAPIRALTVTAIHLLPEGSAYEQVDLFTAAAAPQREKQEKLEAAMARLSERYLERSDRRIAAQLLAMPEYQAAETVFCFVSVGREINTRPVLSAALESGKTLCVPRCLGSRIMELRTIQSLDDLVPGAYGIPEPPEDAPLISVDRVDFAVLPCLTCNHLGQRLGRGGGYYDRFLASYRGGTVLLCREKLIREEIPVTPLDYPIPWVLTEAGLFEDGTPARLS